MKLKYTDEQEEFFKEFVPGHSRKEINAEFNKRFGMNLTESQTTAAYKNRKLSTGRTGAFLRGTSPLKGRKQSDYMSPEAIEKSKATRFQKGQSPANKKPVGSERINVYGYIEVKIAEPNEWTYKHRLVWESVHGPITGRKHIIFLDGNKMNCSIDNLMLIGPAEMALLNNLKLRSEDPELTRTGANYAKLISVIRERSKK